MTKAAQSTPLWSFGLQLQVAKKKKKSGAVVLNMKNIKTPCFLVRRLTACVCVSLSEWVCCNKPYSSFGPGKNSGGGCEVPSDSVISLPCCPSHCRNHRLTTRCSEHARTHTHTRTQTQTEQVQVQIIAHQFMAQSSKTHAQRNI